MVKEKRKNPKVFNETMLIDANKYRFNVLKKLANNYVSSYAKVLNQKCEEGFYKNIMNSGAKNPTHITIYSEGMLDYLELYSIGSAVNYCVHKSVEKDFKKNFFEYLRIRDNDLNNRVKLYNINNEELVIALDVMPEI